MRIAVWYFHLCTRAVLIWLFHLGFRSRQIFLLCLDENSQENFFPIFVSKEAVEAKIWWNQLVQRRTRSLAPDLSDCGPHCFKPRRMVKGTRVEDISPANEAEGQNTTSASHTTGKLLENGRDSETSTAKDWVKHRCRCRRYRPRNFLFLASRGRCGFRKWLEDEV